MAIDNGAKLVIASGPHVLRGMEFYRGHLIAYSLGNSANYHNFGRSGDLAKSAVLRVTLGLRGGFRTGRLVSVRLVDPGRPVAGGNSVAFVRELGKEDFGSVAARLSQSGVIRAPV
jgi:poly-gamma-glutamate capsule biosynthesis protein CapA/YwtB (metallophosphatase superfamily)